MKSECCLSSDIIFQLLQPRGTSTALNPNLHLNLLAYANVGILSNHSSSERNQIINHNAS